MWRSVAGDPLTAPRRQLRSRPTPFVTRIAGPASDTELAPREDETLAGPAKERRPDLASRCLSRSTNARSPSNRVLMEVSPRDRSTRRRFGADGQTSSWARCCGACPLDLGDPGWSATSGPRSSLAAGPAAALVGAGIWGVAGSTFGGWDPLRWWGALSYFRAVHTYTAASAALGLSPRVRPDGASSPGGPPPDGASAGASGVTRAEQRTPFNKTGQSTR